MQSVLNKAALLFESRFFFLAVLATYLTTAVLGTPKINEISQIAQKIMLAAAIFLMFYRRCWPDKRIAAICLVYPLLTALSWASVGHGYDQNLYEIPILFIFFPAVIASSKFGFRDFNKTLVITAGGIAVFGAYIHYGLGIHRQQINTAVGQIIIYDGMMLTLSLVALTYAYSLYREHKSKAFILATVALSAIAIIILDGSRGSWVGLPVICLYLFYMYRRHCKALSLWVIIFLTCFSYYAFLSENAPARQRIIQTQTTLSCLKENGDKSSSFGSRLVMWELTLKDFQSSPIFGVGIEGANERRQQAVDTGELSAYANHAHNIYLHQLSTHGLLGLLGLLFFLLYPLYLFNKSTPYHTAAIMGTVVIVYSMFCGLTDNYLGFNRPLTLYLVLTVFLLTTLKLDSTKIPSATQRQ